MKMTFPLIVVLFKKIFSTKSSHFQAPDGDDILGEEIELNSVSLTTFPGKDYYLGTSCQTHQKRQVFFEVQHSSVLSTELHDPLLSLSLFLKFTEDTNILNCLKNSRKLFFGEASKVSTVLNW